MAHRGVQKKNIAKARCAMGYLAGESINAHVRRTYERRTGGTGASSCDAERCTLHGGAEAHATSATWGPAYWRVLHTMAIQYPRRPKHADRVAYEHALVGMVSSVPCAQCRHNFALHAREAGYAMGKKTRVFDSRVNLCAFVYNVHQLTTRSLARPWRHGSLAQVVRHHAGRDHDRNNSPA